MLAPHPRLVRAIAPAAALSYPLWIACGPRLSPVFVFAALAVPAVGLLATRTLARGPWQPRSLVIALLAVAAPPLFTLLGVWLDFQHAVPLDSTRLWIVLWCALLVVAVVEAPRPRPPASSSDRRLAFAHGVSAAIVSVFIAAHLVNHVGGLWGGDVHVAIMRSLRTVYRARAIEPGLVGAIAFQVVTGAVLLRRKLARELDGLDVVQTASGTILLLFLVSHVGAVLRARAAGIDTSWPWLATGTLLSDPWNARLVPYYALAVLAVGVHVGNGLRSILVARGARGRALGVLVTAAAAATITSTAIMVAMLRRGS